LHLKSVDMGLTDFETIGVIGKSAFDGVRIVQVIDTGRIYTMKTKKGMSKRDQVRSPRLALYVMRYADPALHLTSVHRQFPHVRSAIS